MTSQRPDKAPVPEVSPHQDMSTSVKAFDCRNRVVRTVKGVVANILVANGHAKWIGRKYESAIRLEITRQQLALFLEARNFKPAPEARALDSKTHTRERLVYRHVRNHHYSPEARFELIDFRPAA